MRAKTANKAMMPMTIMSSTIVKPRFWAKGLEARQSDVIGDGTGGGDDDGMAGPRIQQHYTGFCQLL
jgi:hypothetical protein